MMSPTDLPRRPLFVVALLIALVWEAKCQCTTSGGTQPTAETCVFPFTYEGTEYYTCTTVNNGNTAWCAITDNYPVDQLWGICDNPTTATTGGNANGADCVFPFTYNDVVYTTCTTENHPAPWCATTDNYPVDGVWGECLPCSETTSTTPPASVTTPACDGATAVGTTGGTANGAVCNFPFIYQGTSYDVCITTNNGNLPWCATVPNYDDDKTWGNCGAPATAGGNANGADCVFPFTYNDVVYTMCTTENHPAPWCATTDNYPVDGVWGECLPCSETASTTLPASVTNPACDGATAVGTTGGTANGAVCNFPFIYQGTSYDVCITTNNGNQPWCATVPNYDDDKTWGNCVVGTTGGTANGAVCNFPFIYQGTSYDVCITTNNGNQPWCATVPNYDDDKTWGNCGMPCSESTATTLPASAQPTTPSETTPTVTTPTGTMPVTTPACDGATTVGTTGGTANGAVCNFPFIYQGTSYDVCITTNNGNQPWCATVPNYDDDKTWGNCGMPCSESTATTLPASAQPTTPSETTPTVTTPTDTMPVTTPACDGATTVGTTGGTANGAVCNFPFIYQGTSYDVCITTNNGNQPWCATVPNYDDDKTWGNCGVPCSESTATTPPASTQPTTSVFTTPVATTPTDTTPVTTPGCDGATAVPCSESTVTIPPASTQTTTSVLTTPVATTPTDTTPVTTPGCDGATAVGTTGGTANGAVCNFPFIYQGTSYDVCITTNNGNQRWCATVPNYDDDKTWGNCGDEFCVTGTPTGTPTTTPQSLCPVMTEGGTDGGQNCQFPFTYNDQPQYACITVNYNKPWCGTTTNFPVDRLWGECIIMTTIGNRCQFPFNYKGVSYSDCTLVDQNSAWCATVPNLVSLTNTNEWGFCSTPMEPNCPTATTTGSTPVVTGGCIDTFNEVVATLAFGGMYQAGILTVEACRTACLADATCVAVDWSLVAIRCFIHQDGYLDRVQMNSPNVNQYRRVPCLTTSTVGTTQAGATPVCADTFQTFPSTNAYNGISDTNAVTVEACQASCVGDTQCQAFDFTAINRCFIHYDGYLNRLGSVATSTQYRRIPCDVTPSVPATTPACPVTYSILANTLALGGEASSTAMAVTACQMECTALGGDCIAFDFNRDKNICYFHDTLDDVIMGVATVDQYRKSISCVSGTTVAGGGTPSGCVDTFVKRDNTFSFQGTEVVGINTLVACEAVCLAEDTCEAVDYNRLTMKCFWHTAATILTLRSATNIDQYIRQRCETTAAQETTIVGGCIDTFNAFPNTLSLQGTGRGTVADVDACQAICLSDATCAAFDFNRAKRDCYTHDTDFLDRLGNASPANIDQYRRVYCTSAATDTTIAVGTATSLAASTACDPFQEFPMTASSGGAEIVGPRTLEDCKADCAADAACVGFDFNLNQNKCYGHSSTAAYSQTTSALRINQYRKTGTCQGVPTTAAPTTETQAPGGATVATCDTFTMVGSTRSQNGTPNPLATTVSACTSSCMALANCAAFDFNPSTLVCTLHAMNFMDTVQVDVSGTNQYRRIFCQ